MLPAQKWIFYKEALLIPKQAVCLEIEAIPTNDGHGLLLILHLFCTQLFFFYLFQPISHKTLAIANQKQILL